MTFKLGIVVGHTDAAGGAVGLNLPREYDYHKSVASDMLAFAQSEFSHGGQIALEVRVFFRDGIGVSGAYKQVNNWVGTDASRAATIELHYNAATPAASGTETLSSGSARSLELSKRVHSGLCSLLGRSGQSRGIKVRNRTHKERGWLSLVSGRPPAIITEPAFGSNPSDAALLKEKKFLIGREIIRRSKLYFDEIVGG
ncbi:N-acetylmuramoyl-L-alanine amidase [Leisingera aquaemixtae]|uniref:N-acetylmuramoyl-L-alanine amidase n=1 Tax=Leisingera aquaemixtae TaxID=1396826 RepID=A0A0P1H8G9_9RHOB|nr:N-acetylmuramoyl-L-alanine amidase [Leisingera aquaemixtae]CUH99172.1 N-acetylmuramoyl-L-alanine amidase [Leisingera aquaemixtae]